MESSRLQIHCPNSSSSESGTSIIHDADDVDTIMSNVVRLNAEAIQHWIARDVVLTERLMSEAQELVHMIWKRLALGNVNTTTTAAPSKHSRIRTFTTKVSVQRPNDSPDRSSCRPYQKAFLLFPMIKAFDHESMCLITIVVLYNVGLFYHLGGGSCHIDHLFRRRLAQRYYHQANVRLDHFMDSTRQPLWNLQSAIWHNLADNAIEITTSLQPTAAKAANAVYHCCEVWVNMSQLEAFVGWVEDAADRTFFLQSIQLVKSFRSAGY